MRRLLAATLAALTLVPTAAAARTYTVTVNRGVAGINLGATYAAVRGRLGELVQDDWPLPNQVCKMFLNYQWLELCFNERLPNPIEAIHAMQPLDRLGKTARYCLAGVGYCLGDRAGVAALKRRYGSALRGPVRGADGSVAYSLVGRVGTRRVETVFRIPPDTSSWGRQGRIFGAYMSFCGRQAKNDPRC